MQLQSCRVPGGCYVSVTLSLLSNPWGLKCLTEPHLASRWQVGGWQVAAAAQVQQREVAGVHYQRRRIGNQRASGQRNCSLLQDMHQIFSGIGLSESPALCFLATAAESLRSGAVNTSEG